MQTEQWHIEMDKAVEVARRLTQILPGTQFPDCDVRELAQRVITMAESYGDSQKTPTYAEIAWTAEDVQTLRDDLTIEQADDFLARNEKWLRDPLIERGWDIIADMLQTDDQVPRELSEQEKIDRDYPVPAGKQRKRGVEYGCGKVDCTDCYEDATHA